MENAVRPRRNLIIGDGDIHLARPLYKCVMNEHITPGIDRRETDLQRRRDGRCTQPSQQDMAAIAGAGAQKGDDWNIVLSSLFVLDQCVVKQWNDAAVVCHA